MERKILIAFILPILFIACNNEKEKVVIDNDFIESIELTDSCHNELDSFESMELQSQINALKGALSILSKKKGAYRKINIIRLIEKGEVNSSLSIALTETSSNFYAMVLNESNSTTQIDDFDYEENFKEIDGKSNNRSKLIVYKVQANGIVSCNMYENLDTKELPNIKNLSFFE